MPQTWGWAPAPPAPWRDNRRFVRRAAAVWVLSAVVAGVVGFVTWSDLEERIRRGGRLPVGLGSFGGPLGGISGLVALGGQILGIIATWRLAKAHEAFGRPGTRFGAGWAIAGRVIPFASTVIPGLQLGELWRGSAPDVRPGHARWKDEPGHPAAIVVIVSSIATLLVSGIAGIAFAVASLHDLDTPLGDRRDRLADVVVSAHPWMMVASAIALVGTLANAWLLVRIADRQQALHEAEPVPPPPSAPAFAYAPAYVAPPAPVLPPGWYADPSGRFTWRWWDGATWTAQVSRDGLVAHDPPPGG